MDTPRLEIKDLSISFAMYDPAAPFFQARQIIKRVVDGVSLSLYPGEIVALIGASGSGKTLLAEALVGSFEPNCLVEGEIFYEGKRVFAQDLAKARGRRISLVPQSLECLDPLMRIQDQLQEMLEGSTSERKCKVHEALKLLDLPPEVGQMYPFELSGGMARRVLLAMGLIGKPEVVVADEPTPGLDAPRAAQALSALRHASEMGSAVLIITHDIELALRLCQRVAIFHEGKIIELCSVEDFADPKHLQHPFSRALWYALPEHGFNPCGGEHV